MVFSSLTFLCLLLPVVVLLHTLIKDTRVRNGVLLVVSILFYAWGEPFWILAMFFSVLVNYLCGVAIEKAEQNTRVSDASRRFYKKLFLTLALIFSFSFLVYFKYSLFALNSVRALLGMVLLTNGPSLPIGISFFTFSIATYTIDVYRGKSRAQKNPLLLLLYICLFPHLIAGPIIQYNQISEMLTTRTVDSEGLRAGFSRFCIGLAKKVLVANQCALAVSQLPQSTGMDSMSVLGAWTLLVLFTLQIYFDFSGYSDMAIGMGRMLGFRFPENFNNPYVSRSITEFWRRWHMTLGAFFREYLYIPLGGNRVGRARLVFNLLLVWALTGLWHGASWSFIAWGALYGVVIIAERFIGMERLERIPTGLRIAGTLLLVMCGWSLFYNPTLAAGFANIAAMFGIGAVGVADAAAIYVLKRNLLLVLFAATACLPWAGYLTRYMESRSRWTRGKRALAMALPVLSLVLLLLSVTFLVGQSFNPFMYFRF